MSTGGTRKITRATSSNEGFSQAFVVVLQKASFPFKEPTWQRLIRSFENKVGEVTKQLLFRGSSHRLHQEPPASTPIYESIIPNQPRKINLPIVRQF